MAGEFDPEQKRYLEGFASGLKIAHTVRGGALNGDGSDESPAGVPTGRQPAGPDAAICARKTASSRPASNCRSRRNSSAKLHPFDAYSRLKDQAARNEPPKTDDNFRWRFFGPFYCAPTEKSYMCRLRIPNGILKHWQLEGLGELAERYGGGMRTRRHAPICRSVRSSRSTRLSWSRRSRMGLCSRGSGADTIRNITGSPTAGIDPHELIDTRPFARELHFHILNDRSLYGLPRKFNIGLDGGGLIPVLEDTNDIGFTAVKVPEGTGVEAGVWFRLALGGITGRKDFAHPSGVLVKPAEAAAVADAVVRVFIDRGDRSDRKKARLRFVLDGMVFAAFLGEVEAKLGRPLRRVDLAMLPEPNRQQRQIHVGVHPQKQPGLVRVGVVLPVGKMTAEQMRVLSAIACELGDGDIRLTVWQNLLLSGIARERAADAESRLQAIGLSAKATSIRAGLVACTGNTGCKFAASKTKGTALAIAEWVEPRLALDSPINIHLTGCPNSCAQHYIGDIGLLACRVPAAPASDDTMEGFHVFVGGGFGADQGIGRELYRDIRAEDWHGHQFGTMYLAPTCLPGCARRSQARLVDPVASRGSPRLGQTVSVSEPSRDLPRTRSALQLRKRWYPRLRHLGPVGDEQ